MYTMRNHYIHQNDYTIFNLLVWAAVIGGAAIYLRRRRPAGTAFGTASWATDKLLRAWGMMGRTGLILGRTLRGAMIRLPRYCHVLLIGGTGSGKGIGIIIPNLFAFHRGSTVVLDVKGDLFATTAEHRRHGGRVYRVAPFNGGIDRFNPLDTIFAGDPLLIDHAGAMSEALVVQTGAENDPHWNQKASQIIKVILVFVLLKLKTDERNLNSVQDIASDPAMLSVVGDKLREMGGIYVRFGSHIKGLFDKDGLLSREGSGVMSTVARHLSFLDSEMVAKSVAESTFDVRELLEPGVTLYLHIPPEQLEAQKGYLRCVISTLIRVLGSSGSEENSEILMLLDESSSLNGLAAVEECLVRGRSSGIRMLLVYQSHSQVEAAFPQKKTLIPDNCGTHIHMGPPSSFEHAERLSKSLGDWTQWVQGEGDNWGRSSNVDGTPGGSVSSGGSTNRAQQAHPLMRASELLTMGEEYLIVFHRGLPAPILGRRIKWFEDPEFNRAAPKRWRLSLGQKVALVVIVACCIALFFLGVQAREGGYGYWQR